MSEVVNSREYRHEICYATCQSMTEHTSSQHQANRGKATELYLTIPIVGLHAKPLVAGVHLSLELLLLNIEMELPHHISRILISPLTEGDLYLLITPLHAPDPKPQLPLLRTHNRGLDLRHHGLIMQQHGTTILKSTGVLRPLAAHKPRHSVR